MKTITEKRQIGTMVQSISDNKWKYIFTLDFNIKFRSSRDYWSLGRQIENTVFPLLEVEGKTKNFLLVLKFESTKSGQLHVHGLIGGKIRLDETTFEDSLKSGTFSDDIRVTSTHFRRYISKQGQKRLGMKKGWIPYIFKEPDVSSDCNTLYYISKGVDQLIRKNNNEIEMMESGKIPLEQISQWRVARFHPLLSDQFKKRYLDHSLECLFSGRGVF